MEEKKPWPEEWCDYSDVSPIPVINLPDDLTGALKRHLRRQAIIDDLKESCGVS